MTPLLGKLTRLLSILQQPPSIAMTFASKGIAAYYFDFEKLHYTQRFVLAGSLKPYPFSQRSLSTYKAFTDWEVDVIEIMLQKLYTIPKKLLAIYSNLPYNYFEKFFSFI